MNPLRKRFHGDTVVAQRYTGEAMDLLAAVHDQMRLGGLSQLTMHRTLGNGVELHASSRFGQDEIQVRTVRPAPAGREGVRSYCVWEEDYERFSAAVVTTHNGVAGPHITPGQSIHFGGRVEFNGSAPVFTTYLYDPVTLAQTGELAGVGSFLMYPDVVAKKYYYPTAVDTGGSITFAVGLAEGDDSGYTVHTAGVFNSTGLVTLITYKDGRGSAISFNKQGYAPVFATPYTGSTFGNATVFPGAISTPEGDLLEVDAEFGRETVIRKWAGRGGDSATYDLPAAMAGNGDNINTGNTSVVSSGGDNIWLLWYPPGAMARMFSFKSGEWQERTPEEGYGAFTAVALTNATLNLRWAGHLYHDPVSGAVCVVNSDFSGAWIYNAHDCNNIEIAPFYRKFNTVPMTMEPTADGEPNVHNVAAVTQFYRGVIYVRYEFFSHFGSQGIKRFNTLFGAYKVGKVLQKKQTNVE